LTTLGTQDTGRKKKKLTEQSKL